MHLRSHLTAYRAHWIVRYLDPREAPWKLLVDHCIEARHPSGRRALLTKPGLALHKLLPHKAHYLIKCFRDFENLGVTQNTSVLSSAVQGEPLFRNNRFDLSLPRGSQHAWEVHLQTYIISDLIGDDGAPFTDADWDGFFTDYAPDEIRNTPTIHEFTDQRASDLRTIRATIPRDVLAAATEPHSVESGDIVAIVDETGNPTYARVTIPFEGGPVTMHALWLDATRRPHLTGSLTTWTNCAIVEASIWAAPSADPEVEIDFHDSPGADLHLITIGGPVTTIFPVR